MALTEPSPGCVLKIDEVRTTGEALDCYVAENAGLKKANADKARIRELIQPKSLWQKLKDLF